MLRFKIIATVAVVTTILQIAGILYATTHVRQNEQTRMQQDVVLTLRMAASLLSNSVPGLTVGVTPSGDVERLSAPSIGIFADHRWVDQIEVVTGDGATIFAFDPSTRDFTRFSTTILNSQSQRALGTTLDKSSPAYAALAAGTTYTGEAVILGSEFMAKYMPIQNAEGAIIGALAVTKNVEYLRALLRSETTMLAVQGAILVVCITGVMWILLTLILKGLGRLQVAANDLAEGKRDMTVPDQNRRDEVGLLARNLESLRGNLQQAEAEQARAMAEEARAQTVMNTMLTELDREVSGVVQAVGEGDLSRSITLRFDQPELQSLATAVNALRDRIQSFAGDIGQTLKAMAAGDLTQGMPLRYNGAFGKIAEDANETLMRLGGVLGEVLSAADENRRAVANIDRASNDLGVRVEEQAAALQETAATMEEMAASVRANAASLSEAEAAAVSARQTTQAGGSAASAAVAAVGRIAESSKQIAEILKVIDSIAFQTNLLALNAAVEAARAGDAGKGFAVVANEVGNLARQSSEAAREISTLVARNQGSVEEGVEMVRNAGSALESINAEIDKLSHRVATVSLAGREQSTGIEEVNRAVSGLDQMTQENASLTERTAAEVNTLNVQMTRLVDSLANLRLPGAARVEDRWVA